MTAYIAHQPDADGFIHYSDTENQTWAFLIKRQLALLPGRASTAYLHGLELLDFPKDRVPQLPEVNAKLQAATGWQVEPVPALIPFGTFFELLAHKKFPAATFIRTPEQMDYLQEPDIFHELFGHCPLLTDPTFAEFAHQYGKLGLAATPKQRVYLARIFWYTVEFGLIREAEGLRIYGAGILSSPGETQYALTDPKVVYHDFSLELALRTPYRIDIFQPQYFVIDSFAEIFHAMQPSILDKIATAQALGDLPPLFEPKHKVLTEPVVATAMHDC